MTARQIVERAREKERERETVCERVRCAIRNYLNISEWLTLARVVTCCAVRVAVACYCYTAATVAIADAMLSRYLSILNKIK